MTITPTVPRSFGWKVFKAFEEKYREQLGGLFPAYDGLKALYSPRRLSGISTDPVKFDVEFSEEGSDKPRVFEIAIKEVATVTMEALKQPGSGGESAALQALDIALRMSPSMKFASFGRSFYSSYESRPLQGGLELWNGYYQSIRPSLEGLILNLDVSATAYHSSGPCLDVLAQVLNRRDVQDLSRGISRSDWQKADKYFKGVKVQINYRGAMKRSYRVLGLTNTNASESRFHNAELNRDHSVAEYFEHQYNIRLNYPSLPCFRVGNPQRTTMIPMEVCDLIPGQRYPRRLNELQTADMVKATSTRPDQRANKILSGIDAMGYDRDQYLQGFGLKIDNDMMTVNARVIPPPSLQYHPSSRERTLTPQNGGWNLRDKKVPVGKTLNSWSVVCFGSERDFPRQSVENFVTEFCRGAQDTGMNVTNRRPPILYGSPRNGVESTLKNAYQAAGNAANAEPQIIMCILPNTGTPLYAEIKRTGETVLGVATQCCQGKHIRRPNRQYIANVTLKINTKLGGTNVQLSDGLPFIKERPTMVVGCDVTHPDPGDRNKPSICAVVASWNIDASQYCSLVRVQKARQEIVGSLQELMVEHFRNFYQANQGIKPQRLIFFRDGVSNGQFSEVCFTELKAIFKAWRQLEAKDPLQVSFIVVQKRHHARFFPMQREDADRNGNVLPGTVVEGEITSKSEWDFYLNSHGSLQGTSRPAHYYILFDECGFTADQFQTMIYHFCYTFCRATRAVSVVPPAYYADLLAYRSRFHSIGAWEDTTDSERSDQALNSFSSVKPKLERTMYFV